jgi:16S rRNA (cytosine1402-N4)-methyltransferase
LSEDAETGVRHVSVMADEIVESLCRPGVSRFVDATLGDGGHSERILDAADPGAQLLALDWDDTAFSVAKRRLERFGDRVTVVRSGFGELAHVLEEHGWGDGVDAVIADLGVSSRHLDTAERGFSFGKDGPLDMRMDRRRPESAADLLERVGEKELADIIYEFGEERASRRIAREIVKRREERPPRPLRTTADLRAAVISAGVRGRPGHDPATRTFQALRIAVNDELGELDSLLEEGWRVLRPGGRFAILTYHSLEDRRVKRAFRGWAAHCLCPPRRPICDCGWTAKVKLVARRKLVASDAEIAANPRARSAGLRVAERLG